MERPNDPLQLPKPTRNTCKIANKLMTIASGEINLQKKDLTCHVAKVKAATSAHSMADVIPFFSEFNIPFESNASKKPKDLFTTKKTLSVTFPLHHCSNSFWQISISGCVIQSRSRFGRVEVWVWSPTKKRKKNPVQSKNRARPMAARLKNSVQSKNRARPMAARLINPV